MLKGIPEILTPDLLKIMMEMGHGDTLVIGDGNFPAASIAKDSKLVRLGHEFLDMFVGNHFLTIICTLARSSRTL